MSTTPMLVKFELHKLDYKENNLSFIIDIVGYKNIEEYTYEYQLEGYDENWKSSTSGRIEVFFSPTWRVYFQSKVKIV